MHKRRYRYCIEKAFLALYRGRKKKEKEQVRIKEEGREKGNNREETISFSFLYLLLLLTHVKLPIIVAALMWQLFNEIP